MGDGGRQELVTDHPRLMNPPPQTPNKRCGKRFLRGHSNSKTIGVTSNRIIDWNTNDGREDRVRISKNS